ncbi:MAG: hypothetical protein Q4A28_02230 [Brachymonas sp.]|nr:hypothetical protein [Brachymonas sp.]
MLIFGTQTVYRKLGYVADFCPICRSQQAFVLRRIGSAGHLYFISLGQGKLIGHNRTCQNCHTTFEADTILYHHIASRQPFSLAQLAQQTFPDFQSVYAERLELEQAIRFSPFGLSEADRHRLLREPFLLLSPKLEQRADFFRLDWINALTLLALVLGPILLLQLAEKLQVPEAATTWLLLAAVGGILIAWYHFARSARFVQRHLLPQLARALLPLRPSQHEIETVLHELRQHGLRIGKKIKAPALMQALHDAPPHPAKAYTP